jgi:hypothetical protein
MATVAVLGLVLCVFAFGVISGGVLNLYFSLKSFVTRVIESAVPPEIIDRIVEEMPDGWRKWLVKKVLSIVRLKVVEGATKFLTSADTALGVILRGMAWIVLLAVSVGIVVPVSYFAGIPIYISLGAMILGCIGGYLLVVGLVDPTLNYMVTLTTGYSKTAIESGAQMVGLRLVREVSGELSVVDKEEQVKP